MRTIECDRNRTQVNSTSLRSELNSDPPSPREIVKELKSPLVEDLSPATNRIKKKARNTVVTGIEEDN
ncbi:MAG TPA: hypothetical protein DEG17_18960 [Cyanobacteria bacterium UBA11149]|nr:hypothetical protein [Cyanobacteria bacterium UBA11367]HBE57962.1 hypothetical protein [Cyanobacteria bacterium UBA11366]HBK62325.1 hypothetical protein [Cyanobacteria bacterium UBA11166]HBR76037.1 hypothetical protein [Cyanobacteria bacterium UBA11159]HBS71047.1 hypothetical protein [Cyanobacteria bacterium UBA11153]HBW90891.1 hypothetical protein [Cyanobacteria bacterium UBA11149]HCA95804.1 hypothetical protein [Cyanobacteria bacterium UBA9226]